MRSKSGRKAAMFRSNKNPFLAKLTMLSYYLDQIVSPFIFLWLRIYISQLFFDSGKKSIADMGAKVLLFKDEYKISFFSPVSAAYLSTFFELVCPVLLIIGLATRVAALPLLGMVVLIQFMYMQSNDHLVWMMILLVLIAKGPEKFSLDYLFMRHFQQR